ncbi:MAG: hypothetical protein JSW11_14590 [Candidatus Heimdallarchaeota archaeon]|nr:MAG: hypothetical protein JSW11_14590 [Candidatus Heimdallarchaeota archaeon]
MEFRPCGAQVLIIIFIFSIILTILINYFYRTDLKLWLLIGLGLGIIGGVISTISFIALNEQMWIEDGSECPPINLGLFLPILIIPTIILILFEILILQMKKKNKI